MPACRGIKIQKKRSLERHPPPVAGRRTQDRPCSGRRRRREGLHAAVALAIVGRNMKPVIEKMNREEAALAVEWAAREGWNPGCSDAGIFYDTDPDGFFMARLGSTPVAVLSAVRYGDDFGFMGFYIAAPEHRNKGYGGLLALAGIKHLDGVPVGLDGVEAQQANYARHGFVMAHANVRYQGIGPGAAPAAAGCTGAELRSIQPADLPGLFAYDRRHFPADREAFLRAWIFQPGATAVLAHHDGAIVGYGVRRPCYHGHKIAPLFAASPDIAAALFHSLRSTVPADEAFFIDVPQPNQSAVALAAASGMVPVFKTARMYRGPAPELPLSCLYGITSFELG